MNYSIIKASPARNKNFTTYPKKGRIGLWYAHRLPARWSRNDRLFIWAGSPWLKVIGIATLITPNAGRSEGSYWFRLRYLSDLIEGPPIKELRRSDTFRDASFLKVGPAGTIHPLTAQQGAMLETMIGVSVSTDVADPVFGDEPLQAEGRKRVAKIMRAERSPTNRRAVLARQSVPYRCEACGMDFASRYGPDFGRVIQVHHKRAVAAALQKPRPSHFLLLCANCHVVAHFGQRLNPRSLQVLQRLLAKHRRKGVQA